MRGPAAAPGGRLRRVGAGLAPVLVLSLAAAATAAVWSVRRPFPQASGTLDLPGLDGPVDVYRDELGVPTIVATTSLDLFRAQGFVHAQDRFWQMDVWRHIARGRTAELFGPAQLDTDRFLRTLGFERVAEAELGLLTEETRAIAEAYASGVNAYTGGRPPRALGFEYAVLGLQRPGYEPRAWEPLDSVAFLKLMAWDLRRNLDQEIERAVLVAELGEQRAAELFPPHDAAPVIAPEAGSRVAGAGAVTGTGAGAPRAGHSEPVADLSAAVTGVLAADVARAAASVDALTGRAGDAVGSNSWVLSGERTATGAPILANDPHLSIQMPSIWYQVGLRCAQRTAACVDDVAGFSFAGLPGVVIGHNDRIAWGFTNKGSDVMDLFVERLDPDDPDRYAVEDGWADMEVVQERLRAGDGRVETLAVRQTRNGTVVSGVYGPVDDLEPDVDGPYALALRWTALEPGRTLDAVPALNRARDWDEFRAAAALFEVPSQNLVYADVEGNIGYQAPGRIPIRASGDGTVPAPGWTGEHGWVDTVPFDELPSVLNPDRGWIVTANNPVAGDGYPHFLGADWDHGFRAARIIEMIEEHGGGITLDDVQSMQMDSRDPGAQWLVPLLLDVDAAAAGLDDPGVDRVVAVQRTLTGWDGHAEAGSAGAAAYQATWRHLLARMFHPRMPEAYRPVGSARWMEVVRRLAENPDSSWWDDEQRAGRQHRDDTLAMAMADAHAELEARLGGDPAGWRWGDLHQATFRNGTLGESGVALVERRFNRGPYPVGGSSSVVQANGWQAHAGYDVVAVPSMRMIVDLGDLDRSRAVHGPGQSGHAYHRDYTSMVAHWQSGAQHQPGWDLETVAARAAHRLRLEP